AVAIIQPAPWRSIFRSSNFGTFAGHAPAREPMPWGTPMTKQPRLGAAPPQGVDFNIIKRRDFRWTRAGQRTHALGHTNDEAAAIRERPSPGSSPRCAGGSPRPRFFRESWRPS